MVLWLALVWVGLWGSVTFANVLGGLAVAVLLVLLLPLGDVPGETVVAPGALLRFAGQFFVDLLTASWQVAVVALRPQLRLRQAVLAVPVRGTSDTLLTLLADAISLTPGTLTIEVDRPGATLYVHVLDVGAGREGVEQVRTSILRQEAMAIRAVGTAEARAALAADERRENNP